MRYIWIMNYRLIISLLFCIVVSNLFGQSHTEDAIEHYESQEYAQALKSALNGLEQMPEDYFLLTLAAKASNQLGYSADAKNYFIKALKKKPNDKETLKELAKIYEKQGDISNAVKYYSLLTVVDPDDYIAHRQCAKLYGKQNLNKEALKYYSKANKISPRDINTLIGMSNTYIKLNDLKHADSLNNIALSLDKGYLTLYNTKAWLKSSLQQFDSTTVVLQQLEKLKKLDHYENRLMGTAYFQQDSVHKSIEYLEKAMDVEDIHPQVFYYLAHCHEKLGDRQKAISYMKKCRRVSVDNYLIKANHDLSRFYQNEEKTSTAIKLLKINEELQPSVALYYELATATDRYYKDKSIAMKYYAKYLKLADKKSKKYEFAQQRYRYLKGQEFMNIKE